MNEYLLDLYRQGKVSFSMTPPVAPFRVRYEQHFWANEDGEAGVVSKEHSSDLVNFCSFSSLITSFWVQNDPEKDHYLEWGHYPHFRSKRGGGPIYSKRLSFVNKETEEIRLWAVAEYAVLSCEERERWSILDMYIRLRAYTMYILFSDIETYCDYVLYEKEIDDGEVFVYTLEEWSLLEKEREEEKRLVQVKKMECWTQRYCQERQLKFGSVEFFDSLSEHFELKKGEWESRIEGMREDGLCIGMGATVESWYDHMDGLRIGKGRVDDLASEVFEWCEEYLPLRFALWRESRAVAV